MPEDVGHIGGRPLQLSVVNRQSSVFSLQSSVFHFSFFIFQYYNPHHPHSEAGSPGIQPDAQQVHVSGYVERGAVVAEGTVGLVNHQFPEIQSIHFNRHAY